MQWCLNQYCGCGNIVYGWIPRRPIRPPRRSWLELTSPLLCLSLVVHVTVVYTHQTIVMFRNWSTTLNSIKHIVVWLSGVFFITVQYWQNTCQQRNISPQQVRLRVINLTLTTLIDSSSKCVFDLFGYKSILKTATFIVTKVL